MDPAKLTGASVESNATVDPDGPFSTSALATSRHRMWDNMVAMNQAWWTLWGSSFTAPWNQMPWPPAGQMLPPEPTPPVDAPVPVLKSVRDAKRKRKVPLAHPPAKRLRHP